MAYRGRVVAGVTCVYRVAAKLSIECATLNDGCAVRVLKIVTGHKYSPPCVAQLVTCLTVDTCLTADPGVASSIPARSHTFAEIDHERISTAILLPFAEGLLSAKVCARSTG